MSESGWDLIELVLLFPHVMRSSQFDAHIRDVVNSLVSQWLFEEWTSESTEKPILLVQLISRWLDVLHRTCYWTTSAARLSVTD